ncbi:MAG: hypothetical protein JXA89_22315, partial [Anaerolineae bacterium]|nr:hypothetical protein [Anaerolineae bacterium]
MKRRDALRKVRTICERLDQIDPDTFYIHPLKLYLFGSVLTDKPDPQDVDLLLLHKGGHQSEKEALEIVAALAYGLPAPFDRASTHLRRGMTMVRLHEAEDSLRNCFMLYLFPDGEGLHLIWKPGLDWRATLDEIEAHPLPWSGPRSPEALEQAREAWR